MKTKHEIIDRLAEIGRQIRILELEEFALIRKLYKMKHIISCESEPIKLTDNTSQIDGLSEEEQAVLNIIIENGGKVSDSTLNRKGLLPQAMNLCLSGYLKTIRNPRNHHSIFCSINYKK